jgi:hypothetical protein
VVTAIALGDRKSHVPIAIARRVVTCSTTPPRAIIVPLRYTVREVFNGGESPYGASFTESYTRTSVVRGIFRTKAKARAEALELLPAA